jgi:hypothetical protein
MLHLQGKYHEYVDAHTGPRNEKRKQKWVVKYCAAIDPNNWIGSSPVRRGKAWR